MPQDSLNTHGPAIDGSYLGSFNIRVVMKEERKRYFYWDTFFSPTHGKDDTLVFRPMMLSRMDHSSRQRHHRRFCQNSFSTTTETEKASSTTPSLAYFSSLLFRKKRETHTSRRTLNAPSNLPHYVVFPTIRVLVCYKYL
jgi:hypothetical protein